MWIAVVAHSRSLNEKNGTKHRTIQNERTLEKKAKSKKHIHGALWMSKPESLTTVKHHLFNFRIIHWARELFSLPPPNHRCPGICTVGTIWILNNSLRPIVSGSQTHNNVNQYTFHTLDVKMRTGSQSNLCINLIPYFGFNRTTPHCAALHWWPSKPAKKRKRYSNICDYKKSQWNTVSKESYSERNRDKNAHRIPIKNWKKRTSDETSSSLK